MRVMRSNRTPFHLFILAVLLVGTVVATTPGCATQGQTQGQAQTIEDGLNYAEITATAALKSITPLLDSGTINVEQAKKIRASAVMVHATVVRTRTVLDAGNAAEARAQLLAIAADLAFLDSRPGATP